MMDNLKRGNRFKRFLRLVYLKFFRIHDTPARVALGLALGVFLGIIPGAGPLAAVFLAFILRLNRASALLGSLATNSWLSLVFFIFALKSGSFIMGLKWQEVYRQWLLFLQDFQFKALFEVSVFQVLIPVALGYILVALVSGGVVYLIALVILSGRDKR